MTAKLFLTAECDEGETFSIVLQQKGDIRTIYTFSNGDTFEHEVDTSVDGKEPGLHL